MRTAERNMSRHLSCEELKQAHNCIIKVTQKQAFREDIHFLEKHGKVPQNSKLISPSPFIDDTGLLRVEGRFKNAPTTKNIHYSCPKIIRSQIYLSSQFTNNNFIHHSSTSPTILDIILPKRGSKDHYFFGA
jgi:hypothetical protein